MRNQDAIYTAVEDTAYNNWITTQVSDGDNYGDPDGPKKANRPKGLLWHGCKLFMTSYLWSGTTGKSIVQYSDLGGRYRYGRDHFSVGCEWFSEVGVWDSEPKRQGLRCSHKRTVLAPQIRVTTRKRGYMKSIWRQIPFLPSESIAARPLTISELVRTFRED